MSNATAMPGMPEKPRPPPATPSALGERFARVGERQRLAVGARAAIDRLVEFDDQVPAFERGVEEDRAGLVAMVAGVVRTTPADGIVAEPLCDQAAPGAGTVPVPLKATSCRPVESSPLSTQTPLA